MLIHLHKQATTTPKVRAALAGLAGKPGIELRRSCARLAPIRFRINALPGFWAAGDRLGTGCDCRRNRRGLWPEKSENPTAKW